MSEPTALHQYRNVAESFGVDAAGYDRARPPYPQELIDRILAKLPGRRVLDVGCGTGIASRQFQAAGCQVLGVEPDERMAEFARSHGLDTEVGTFEQWDPAGRTFDAVVAAQSWHWVDPVEGVAKAAGVLRKDGRLALFGHVFEPPLPVLEAQHAAFQRVVPDSPFTRQRAGSPLATYQALYDKFAHHIAGNDAFDRPESWRVEWRRTYTRDQWLDLLPTTGGMTHLPADARSQVLDAVGEAIDDLGGQFDMEYTTLAVDARRR